MCLSVLLLLAGSVARAGEPDVRFDRKNLASPAGETAWYRYRPGSQGIFDHVPPVLARQGFALNKDYFLDRDDPDGILAVTGRPEAVKVALEIIRFLDAERPQISVSVRIAETLMGKDLQSGIDIGFDRKTSERTFFRGFEMNNRPQAYLDSLLSTKIPFQGTTTEFGTVDASGNILNQQEYDRFGALYMAIRAVAEEQDITVLAQPNVLVSTGEKATVVTGTEYPYQQVTFTGANAVISTKFRPVGITLNVTPSVIGENKVMVELDVTVTNIVGFVEIAQGVKNPYTDERKIANTVVLKNGDTLAIGGILQKETTVIEKGVPVLSDIPLLGLLFKSYWSHKQDKELRIYLTPRIVWPHQRLFTPSIE